ncbi:RidA family protein [uncultured Clostridium sp.]|uniref:RidA family protein n=1 Tax=uncultured Clostridium sp. TaxID=59620 RepID=UPI002672E5DD|nr:RidA family protein [uncultured Clostridium sp.]
MNKEIISTKKAPSAIGPYSQGMIVGDLVFTSGQIPLNPESGELVTEISKATVQVMANLSAVLEAAGSSLEKVIKTTIFLQDLNDFEKVNEIYGDYFKDNLPARSCVQVAKLPKGATIEIEAIAIK